MLDAFLCALFAVLVGFLSADLPARFVHVGRKFPYSYSDDVALADAAGLGHFPQQHIFILRDPNFQDFHRFPTSTQDSGPVQGLNRATSVPQLNPYSADLLLSFQKTELLSFALHSKNSAQHILGHGSNGVPCPACEEARERQMFGDISPEMSFREAAESFANSKDFHDVRIAVRYVARRTLNGYKEFQKPLNRFFADLKLVQIHHGHLRSYQIQRATGKLGPSHEELFAKVCKWQKVSVVDALSNPIMKDFIERRVLRIKHEEVGAAKINQELAFLVRIMRRAGTWTPELEEHYQPLQVQESDVPKALTREEQNKWLNTAASNPRWLSVYYYSVVAFATTVSNVEMRNLRRGDVNLHGRTINIRAATAKNKFRIRTISLNPDAYIAMEWLLDRAQGLGSCQSDHFVWPSRVDLATWDPSKPMSESGLKKQWNEVIEASGVKLTQHGCRHTSITRYAEAGVPLTVIMSMAGHISPKMSQHYITISSAAQQWAINAAYRGEMYPVQKVAMSLERKVQLSS